MSFVLGLFGWVGKLFGGAPTWLFLIIGLLGSGFGYEASRFMDSRQVAILQAQKAEAESERDKVQAAYSMYAVKVAEETARANAEALRQADSFMRDIAKLEKEAEALRQERDKQSEQLTKDLNNAPKGDTQPISPSIRRYLDGVRHSSQTNSPQP